MSWRRFWQDFAKRQQHRNGKNYDKISFPSVTDSNFSQPGFLKRAGGDEADFKKVHPGFVY
jgi:hypothetical protein